MMNILFSAILLVNIAILVVILVSFVKIRATYNNLRNEFRSFIMPGQDESGEAKPSPLATVTLALADQAARSVVSSLKASFLGQASGVSRQEAAIESDAKLDMISAVNPGMGALIQGIPALRKLAKKNPGLLDAALAKFAGGSMGGGGQSAPPTISSGQSNFNI